MLQSSLKGSESMYGFKLIFFIFHYHDLPSLYLFQYKKLVSEIMKVYVIENKVRCR